MVRAEIDPRDGARVCLQQPATVTADAFPNAPVRAHVDAIVPALSVRTISAGLDAKSREAQTVLLSVEQGERALPIGLPVTVRFAACPAKN